MNGSAPGGVTIGASLKRESKRRRGLGLKADVTMGGVVYRWFEQGGRPGRLPAWRRAHRGVRPGARDDGRPEPFLVADDAGAGRPRFGASSAWTSTIEPPHTLHAPG